MKAAPTLDELATDLSLLTDLEQEALVGILMRSSTLRDASMVEMVRRAGSGVAGQDQEDRLLSIDEAAAKLAVPVDWLYRRGKKLGLAVKLDRATLRFSRNAIEAYIRKNLGSVSLGRSRVRKPLVVDLRHGATSC